MANKEHLKILEQGVDIWNEWRNQNPEISPDLSNANLNGINLGNADLDGTDLSKANLFGANFYEANLRGANLSNADLSKANFLEVDLCEANLSGANLSNADLNGADLSSTDLSGANLTRANPHRADLSSAMLTKAILTEANLSFSDLSHADLSFADLSNVNLSVANLFTAKLTAANLSDTDLTGANLTNTYLAEADLTRAVLSETVFANVCLKDVKGLHTCIYREPSIVDHRTIELSGMLPKEFLQGCGLPDSIIKTYNNIANPLSYSCFISYSTKDSDFVEKLYTDLQNNSVQCWFAEHDMQSGQKIYEQVKKAIQSHDRLLLVLSENSMNSEWVHTEIASARERESKESKQMLFPIRLVDYETIQEWKCFDADRGKDSAKEIREYFIPDFQNWQDEEAYKKTFERLLRDIKSPAAGGQ